MHLIKFNLSDVNYYYHEILITKFNLNIFYLPLYLREVWRYKDVNGNLISRSINNTNCEKLFFTLTLSKTFLFSKKKKEVFNGHSNYIPHKSLLDDDQDPSWIESLLHNRRKIPKNDWSYSIMCSVTK